MKNSNLKKLVLSIGVTIVLASCGGGGGTDPEVELCSSTNLYQYNPTIQNFDWEHFEDNNKKNGFEIRKKTDNETSFTFSYRWSFLNKIITLENKKTQTEIDKIDICNSVRSFKDQNEILNQAKKQFPNSIEAIDKGIKLQDDAASAKKLSGQQTKF